MARKVTLTPSADATTAEKRKKTIELRKAAGSSPSDRKPALQARAAEIKASAQIAKAKRLTKAYERKKKFDKEFPFPAPKKEPVPKKDQLTKKLISMHTSHKKAYDGMRKEIVGGTRSPRAHANAAEAHVDNAQSALTHPDSSKNHPAIQLQHVQHAMNHISKFNDHRLAAPYGSADNDLQRDPYQNHDSDKNNRNKFADSRIKQAASRIKQICDLHMNHKDEEVANKARGLHNQASHAHDLISNHTPEAARTNRIKNDEEQAKADRRHKRGLIGRLMGHLLGEEVSENQQKVFVESDNKSIVAIKKIIDEKRSIRFNSKKQADVDTADYNKGSARSVRKPRSLRSKTLRHPKMTKVKVN